MLKNLYSLLDRYKTKKIIIYGVNRSSIEVFASLVLNYQVDVLAFWNADGQFIGESLINRQIINTNQVRHMDDAVVVIPKTQRKQDVLKQAGENIDLFYIDEMLGLNQELRNKKIFLYGIGNRGEVIYQSLQDQRIDVEGVCVTTLGKIERWNGKEVLSIEQVKQNKNFVIILATDIEQYQYEMLKQLENLNVEKYISYFLAVHHIAAGNFFQVINHALVKQKNIVLYGDKNEYTQYLERVLKRCQIEITLRLCDKDIYDLEYEDINNTCVLISENNDLKIEWACNVLDSIGFGLERWDYAATGSYTCKMAARVTGKSDVLIGDSIVENEKYPGYVVYGNPEQAKIRIMVLGGSTSTDGVYRTVSWVKFFYDKLSEMGYSPVIYNGAVCGHGIVDEFLHMMRDIKPLKLDYVINFSGVCNTFQKKAVNQFNIRAAEFQLEKNSSCISGIESNETIYSFWCRISKLMKIVAQYHGAKTYDFLQPMSAAKDTDQMKLEERYMYDYTDHTEHMQNFKYQASAEQDKFYIDLVSMFEDKKEMYIDSCHYSTEANKMIAERVFETVRYDMQKMMESLID